MAEKDGITVDPSWGKARLIDELVKAAAPPPPPPEPSPLTPPADLAEQEFEEIAQARSDLVARLRGG